MIPPPPALDFSILAPLGFVAAGAFLVLLGDGWLSRGPGPVLPWLVMICTAALGLALFTAVTAFAFGGSAPFNATHAMLRADAFSSGLSVVIGVVALLSVWLSMSHLAALRIEDGECYALLMLSVCGMLVSVLAIDMMTLFVGLELMSLPLYALAALDGRSARSGEAGLKFLVLGGLASAIALSLFVTMLRQCSDRRDGHGVRKLPRLELLCRSDLQISDRSSLHDVGRLCGGGLVGPVSGTVDAGRTARAACCCMYQHE